VSRTLFAVGVLLSMMLVIAVAYVIARDRSRGHEPGQTDRVSEDVVHGLMTELQKWQAEAAHWKATAERLQRELDQR
jgi:hypothetical protein